MNEKQIQFMKRFHFPGGKNQYPLGYLNQFETKKSTTAKTRGVLNSKKLGKKIPYDSQLERKEIQRIIGILDVYDIKTQSLELKDEHDRRIYPDIIVQLMDGTIFVVEVKYILDFIHSDVQRKYKVLKQYCENHGFGVTMSDGKWHNFEWFTEGNGMYIPKVIDFLEAKLDADGFMTLQEFREEFKGQSKTLRIHEKYYRTLVAYCLTNGYSSDVTFHDKAWAIQRK
jgi:uncharacterized protein YfbU (UPF0304 family)